MSWQQNIEVCGFICVDCVPGLGSPPCDLSRALSLTSSHPGKCSRFRHSCLCVEPSLHFYTFCIVWRVLLLVSVIYVLLSLLRGLASLYGVCWQWKKIPAASPRWWWIPFLRISAIFIRWSGVSFYLYSYRDMMHFNVVMIMICKFLLACSAPKSKPRSLPPPKEIFLVYKGTHFQTSPFSQDEYRWMGPFFSADNCSLMSVVSPLEAGRGRISSG